MTRQVGADAVLDPRFDAAGTRIGSSLLYATACDFARLGERRPSWGPTCSPSSAS